MARYLNEIRLGKEKHRLRAIINDVRNEFNLSTHQRPVPHITLFGPYDTDQGTQLRDENGRLQDRVSELEDDKERTEKENEELQNVVADLEDRIEELEAQPDIEINTEKKEPITTLTVDGLPVGRRIAGSISEYDWEEEIRPQIEADLGGSDTTPQSGGTNVEQSDLTHIEKISRAAGDDISTVTDSVDARRAVALWRNLVQWGKKTPKGYCLLPADNPVSLLEADQDEDLCWKQYYRACEALEGLSEGAVTFCHSDRHGKMLVFHEQSEAFERAKASLTPSSAQAEG